MIDRAGLRDCLTEHFAGKAKKSTIDETELWLDAAETTLRSAHLLVQSDPRRSLTLCWDAAHDLGKTLAAMGGCRLNDESHGKIADLIICAFPDLPGPGQRVVRTLHKARNDLDYVRPAEVNSTQLELSLQVVSKLIADCRLKRPRPDQ